MGIRSFGNRATKRFARGDRRRLPAELAEKIDFLLKLLDRSTSPEDLPADRDEDLIHMPGIAQPAMPTAQVPSKGETEFTTPQSGRLVGPGDVAPGEQVFDIPAAEGEPMTEPHRVTDDLGCKAVASPQGFHRSSVSHGRHLDRTLGEVSKGAGGPCARLDGEAPAARSVFAEHGTDEGE